VIDATCPVHADFDPLSPQFLRDPYAVLAALDVEEAPVFYAPSLDYYVVTRHADVEQVFLDPATYSAGAAQLPLCSSCPRR
jgi:cytochrome P450